MPIYHYHGSIFDAGAQVVAHQVNCRGVMGSGVAAQVARLYPNVYEAYKNFCKIVPDDELLGKCLLVRDMDSSVYIANLFGQYDFGRSRRHTNYSALARALHFLAEHMRSNDLTQVAIPYKLGCDRGGGDWDVVYRLIEDELADFIVLICFIEQPPAKDLEKMGGRYH